MGKRGLFCHSLPLCFRFSFFSVMFAFTDLAARQSRRQHWVKPIALPSSCLERRNQSRSRWFESAMPGRDVNSSAESQWLSSSDSPFFGAFLALRVLTFQSAICISSCRLTPSAWASRVLTPSLSSATASARNWERWKFNSCIRLGLSGSPGETVVGRGEE